MNQDQQIPGIRRMILGVDLERYSGRDLDGQHAAQRGVAAVLHAAKEATRLAPNDWLTQQAGDGELDVLPPGVDELNVIRDFVRGLAQALHTHNRGGTGERLRLRVAFHEGIVRLADQGFAGRSVVTASRLLDSEPVRQALRDRPDLDLIVILSQPIYEDHVGHQYFDFDADSFRPVHVQIPGKSFATYAWLWAPPSSRSEQGIEQVAPSAETEEARPPLAPASTGGHQAGRDITQNFDGQHASHGGMAAGRDISNARTDGRRQ